LALQKLTLGQNRYWYFNSYPVPQSCQSFDGKPWHVKEHYQKLLLIINQHVDSHLQTSKEESRCKRRPNAFGIHNQICSFLGSVKMQKLISFQLHRTSRRCWQNDVVVAPAHSPSQMDDVDSNRHQHSGGKAVLK
jgi:hypothetical protein